MSVLLFWNNRSAKLFLGTGQLLAHIAFLPFQMDKMTSRYGDYDNKISKLIDQLCSFLFQTIISRRGHNLNSLT